MPSPSATEQSILASAIKFAPGDVVVHTRSGKRGVIIEVDGAFNGPDELLRDMTRDRGPKLKPWYHVLVEATAESLYIAECHLTLDPSGQPVNHPMITSVFTDFENGRYIRLNH
ncbi:MAG: heat shock protein HspQ [Bdellovibrionales bacterium]